MNILKENIINKVLKEVENSYKRFKSRRHFYKRGIWRRTNDDAKKSN